MIMGAQTVRKNIGLNENNLRKRKLNRGSVFVNQQGNPGKETNNFVDMKDELRNRSVWERMKMAFRLLFSVKALEPVYKEGWEDGRRGLYDDYKVMKETIEPFVKKVHDTAWHGDSAITIPGMIPTELYRMPFLPVEDFLGAGIVAGHDCPSQQIELRYQVYRQDTLEKAFQADKRLAHDINYGYMEASKSLAKFLLENGFVKHRVIANPRSPYPTFVFFTNVMKRV